MDYIPFISPASTSMAAGLCGAKVLVSGRGGSNTSDKSDQAVPAGCQHDRLLPYRRFGEPTTGMASHAVLGERAAQEGV